ncbi:MAG: hypothetical protein WBO35_00555 [Candidatus Saccharimonadales bacterium]
MVRFDDAVDNAVGSSRVGSVQVATAVYNVYTALSKCLRVFVVGTAVPAELAPDLGKRIAALCRMEVVFASHPKARSFQVCQKTGGMLALSLEPYEFNGYPSVILAHQEAPVAVIKGSSEVTTFSFTDCDEFGLVKNALD